MQRGFFISGVSSTMAQNRLDNITHNLANVNSTGYKSSRSSFKTVLSENIMSSSQAQASYLSMGTQYIDLKPGAIRQTSNALDFAIIADGFFQVEQKDGTVALTRAGNFSRDAEGNLITQNGLPVLDETGSPITLPEGEVSGTNDGAIYVNGEQAAQLGLAKLIDVTDIQQAAGTLITTSQENIKSANGEVTIQHGALEGSNVNSVLAMTEMVATLRSYESTMKIVEQYNQLAGQLSSNVGKING